MVINFITLQNLLLSAIKVLFQTQSPFPKDRKKEKEKGKKKVLISKHALLGWFKYYMNMIIKRTGKSLS